MPPKSRGLTPWRSYTLRPPRRIGLAAAKRMQREERRRVLLDEWLMRRHLARDRRRIQPDENEIVPTIPRRQGAMSKGELYHWHKVTGTLEIFFAMFPRG